MKIITILGARPQFIKSWAVSKEIMNREENDITEYVIHTGQHYDKNMSEVFFKGLKLKTPYKNLKVAGRNQAITTAEMIIGIASECKIINPDLILVYGDTNSTLAGALAANKLSIPLAHVESGLRSYDKSMPEESNRIITDHLSDYLFTTSEVGNKNLKAEGITKNVFNTGDVMKDVIVKIASKYTKNKFSGGNYVLVTLHRAKLANSENLSKQVFTAIKKIAKDTKVLFPVHPRTQPLVEEFFGFSKYGVWSNNIMFTEPYSYLEMISAESQAKLIITDSGGVQKEAYWLGIPCLTVREETEWDETLSEGYNKCTGYDPINIYECFKSSLNLKLAPGCSYGDGYAARKIVNLLQRTRDLL